jgi:hypothetical protein
MRDADSLRVSTRTAVVLLSSAQVAVVGAAAQPTSRRYELTAHRREQPADPMAHRVARLAAFGVEHRAPVGVGERVVHVQAVAVVDRRLRHERHAVPEIDRGLA